MLKKSRYFLIIAGFLVSSIASLLTTSGSAGAAPTFDQYAVSPTNSSPRNIISVGNSLWYVQDSSLSIDRELIGKRDMSGAVTNYNLSLPNAQVYRVDQIVASPSGDSIWFTGCVSATNSGSGPSLVGRLNTVTGVVEHFFKNTNGCWAEPFTQLAFGPGDNVWVFQRSVQGVGSHYMLAFSATTGAYKGVKESWPAPGSNSTLIAGMTAGPDGNLWQLDSGKNTVIKRTFSAATDSFTGSTIYSIPTPNTSLGGLMAGPDGKLWFYEGSSGKIASIDMSGVITEYSTGAGSLRGFTIGSDGALWASEYSAKKIWRVTLSGFVSSYSIPATLGNPSSMVSGPDGAIWFATTNSIGRLGY